MHNNMRRIRTPIALAILASVAAFSQQAPVSGPRYSIDYAGIADTTQDFISFQTFPAINEAGTVAFVGVRNGYGEGVFTRSMDDPAITTIASTRDNLSFFAGDVCINNTGLVGFHANTATGSRAMFSGNAFSKTLIVDSAAQKLVGRLMGSPSINDSGTVAFFGRRALPGLPAVVFTGNGGPLTTVVETSPTGFAAFGNVAINDSGTVVIRGIFNDGSEGLFTIRDGITDVVDTRTRTDIVAFGDPVINNSGTVADLAGLFSNRVVILSGNKRGVTFRTDPNAPVPFQDTEHPSLNNRGSVAFFAFNPFGLNDGTDGIYLEVSGEHSLIPVIKPGEKLFGSTVQAVTLGRFALNARLQMAFSYRLTDGRSGIAVATVHGGPEGGATR